MEFAVQIPCLLQYKTNPSCDDTGRILFALYCCIEYHFTNNLFCAILARSVRFIIDSCAILAQSNIDKESRTAFGSNSDISLLSSASFSVAIGNVIAAV